MVKPAGIPRRAKTISELEAIPRDVWALGFVSMFMDMSSEAIHSLLPVFLVSVLGATATSVGVLEGTAEGTVLVAKMFSGALSDRLGKRKSLALLGYGLAALTKPLFAMAGSFPVVFAARLMDRVGKGIRGAPRDALIADLVPEQLRGASYGLRQSLDTVGALTGPLAAMLLMLAGGGSFRLVFWVAVLPAFLSATLVGICVHEPPGPARPRDKPRPLHWEEWRRYPASFWWVAGTGAIFTLARFSEAFLVLRGRELGIANSYLPLIMVVMNVIYAASAYPAGWLSDRVDRRLILAGGAAILVIADVVLAAATGPTGLISGVALWGLHMGLSQGLLTTLVADAAPAERRGTAFGIFSLVSGLALLAASILAGTLWDQLGAPAAFYAGAAFAALALLGLLARTATRTSGQ